MMKGLYFEMNCSCEQEGHILEVEMEEEKEVARVVQLFSSLRTLLQVVES